MNHFVNFICKHGNNLTMLELPIAMKYSDVINLSQFTSSISLQKRLEHIILLSRVWRLWRVVVDHTTMLNLLTQNESLQILEFKNLSFYEIDEKDSNSLCLLNNKI